MAYIPYGRQSISEDDVRAVAEVLRSDFLTQGPAVPAFEEAVKSHCGAAHAVAVNSATSALHLACLALDIGTDDLVWTSPVTFVASANCVLYCGARVDFVDIDPKTLNISVEKLASKLDRTARAGEKLPKAVIAVDMCGQSCDMAAIHALAERYGFKVIEDASHAVGGRYRNHPVGNCQYSDIVIFSFHPVKIITTGEGGMALTNAPDLAKKMQLLRSHGITRDTSEMTSPSEGAWYYQQIALGFNYRMTDIQAALGSSQMRHLEEWVSRRHVLAAQYDEALARLPLILPRQHHDTYSAWHLYVIQVSDEAPMSRSEMFAALRSDGIGVNVHYIPVHMQPFYRKLGFKPGDFPAAEDYYSRAISIPMYSSMSDPDQRFVIDQISNRCARS
jgi:UDP-4-amino-4,6-dideoxy-N-acetyl-beta-L-altrosamine transaminase